MYAPLIAVTLRILTFRAGPQDFPFAPSLTSQLCVAALVSQLLVLGQVMSIPLVLLIGVFALGAIALATHAFLRTRNLANRFHQTFGALLATGAVLMLVMAPLFSFAAPLLRAVAADPSLLERTEELMTLRPPVIVNLILDVLFFWNIAVTIRIYRLSGDLRLAGGILITLAVMAFTFMTVLFGTALFGGLFGLGASQAAVTAAPPAL